MHTSSNDSINALIVNLLVFWPAKSETTKILFGKETVTTQISCPNLEDKNQLQ